MKEFGRYLRDLRVAAHYDTQSGAATAISTTGSRKIHQSFVAQLETGKLQSVTPELLKIIAKTYKEPFPALFERYARVRYGVNIREYAIQTFRLTPAKLTLIEQDILDIEGLAEWEKKVPDRGDLWVVTVKLLDYRNTAIRNAIVNLLKRKCTITYFASEKKDFGRLLRQLDASWEEQSQEDPDCTNFSEIVDKQLDFVELEDDEIALMTSSIVISQPREILKANHDGTHQTDAYLVFGEGLVPSYGLRVQDREALRDLVSRLRERLKRHQEESEKNKSNGEETNE